MRFKLGDAVFSGESLNESLMVREFEPGGVNISADDKPRGMRDGMTVGRDFLESRTWAWEISARGTDLTAVLAAGAVLERAWRPQQRLMPGISIPLSYLVDGRWRRVYGRPRRFAGFPPDYIASGGVGHIACDFLVTDPLHYDDVESSVQLTIVPASTGGLMAPLVAPLSTVRSSSPRAGLVANAGDAPTPLKVTFKGPIANPWVRSPGGWEVGLTGSLAYDESITVDPLAGTVTRQDGTPANGRLTRKTRLSGTLLQPGVTELTFGGTDLTGTATAKLSWRNAYTSI